MKYTIIILTHNSERYLKQTLNSVYNQRLSDYELIIIDDYSNDKTIEILKKYQSKTNTKIYKNSKNLGIAKSVNKAVNYAQGKWFLFLGHDDLLDKNHLRLFDKHLDKKTALLHCNSSIINSRGKIIGLARKDYLQKIFNRNPLLCLSLFNYISSCGLIINKKKFISVGGWDESLNNFGEWLLWIKLSNAGNFKYITEVKGYYRKHKSNTIKKLKSSKSLSTFFKYSILCLREAYEESNKSLISLLLYYSSAIIHTTMFFFRKLRNKFIHI